ncbi:MAG: DUF3375 domain-containing protein [Gammaproteobacteria bacterium]
MDTNIKELCANLVVARRQNPAWLLLTAKRAPLVIGCLRGLFGYSYETVTLEDAEQQLAEMLADHSNDDDFDIGSSNHLALARRELRTWIKRGLVVERNNKLIATDALQQALLFIDELNDRAMTSTASRLATVQREIENLAVQLNPDSHTRVAYLRNKIKSLEQQIQQAEGGLVDVLAEAEATEGIREVHNLASSLRADFRRVEDSYREADRVLRQSIVSEQRHRGEIVDSLLDSHTQLLETPEGQVFHGFHQQLVRTSELEAMKRQLRQILANPAAKKALNHHQRLDLRYLVNRLLQESQGVIQARARSEHDVKGYLKSGLAVEHHRVGQLLNEILEQAVNINWQRMAIRRAPAPLPPVAIAVKNFPLVERLRFKDLKEDVDNDLVLDEVHISLDDIDDDFWQSFDSLDQAALIRDSLDVLTRTGRPMSIAELYRELSPNHDLEAIALWLMIARELGIDIGTETETLDVIKEHETFRYSIPSIKFQASQFKTLNWNI